MTQQTVGPYGQIDVTVPVGEKIAISTNGGGLVKIYYQTAPGISPIGFYLQDTIVNEEVLLGTFSTDQGVRIKTSGSPALYDIGASPSVGSGDADTLQGLASTQFARSDVADDISGLITLIAGAILNNNIYISAKESGGTVRVVLGINGSNICLVGNAANEMNVRSSGDINVEASNLRMDNNKYFYGENTTGTSYAIFGVNTSNRTKVGNANLATDIQSNGTLLYNGAALATGTIDTTASQTITVVDGLITNIA